MQQLNAAADIDAAADVVWDVVSDLPRYREWNPFIIAASGEVRPGARLEITIRAPGIRPVTFRPTVLAAEPGRLLRWKGRLWIPGLFDGHHSLIVDDLGPGRARFTTHEDVSGVLTPLLKKTMRASQEGFEQFAAAVKARAERLAHARSAERDGR